MVEMKSIPQQGLKPPSGRSLTRFLKNRRQETHFFYQPDAFSEHTHTPEPLKLHVIHQKVSGLHQLVDLLQQLLLPLSVLVGLVIIWAEGNT